MSLLLHLVTLAPTWLPVAIVIGAALLAWRFSSDENWG